MKIADAKSVQRTGATVPTFVVTVEIPKNYRFPNVRRNVMECVLKEAIYKEIPGSSYHGCSAYVGALRDVHDARYIRPDPAGDKVLHTTKGDIRYRDFYWAQPISSLPHLPYPLVAVDIQTTGWRSFNYDGRKRDGRREGIEWATYEGTIQQGYLPLSVVRNLLVEHKLVGDFTIQGGRVEFWGDRETVRGFEVAQHYNKLTWMAHYKSRPNESADWSSDWSGSYFPDEAAARLAGEQWVKYRSKTYCFNLKDLQGLFPEHPAVPKVEYWENAERIKNQSRAVTPDSQWSAV